MFADSKGSRFCSLAGGERQRRAAPFPIETPATLQLWGDIDRKGRIDLGFDPQQ